MSEFGTFYRVTSKMTARVVRYKMNIKTFMQSYQNKSPYVKRNIYSYSYLEYRS